MWRLESHDQHRIAVIRYGDIPSLDMYPNIREKWYHGLLCRGIVNVDDKNKTCIPKEACYSYGCLWKHVERTQTAIFKGPTWGPPGADRTQVGHMLSPWALLSGYCWSTMYTHHSWIQWQHGRGPILLTMKNLIPTSSSSNYIHDKIWDETTYKFPNFNGTEVEVWQMISTPLWISNRNFYSTQIFYHLFFAVCCSFYTWYMWGDQYQFCKFLLDFDHWLYLSDILNKVTGSKPDVALVWLMQWAKMGLEHEE